MHTNANIPVNEEIPKANILRPVVDVICYGIINNIQTNDINISSFKEFENAARMYLNEPIPMVTELPSVHGTHRWLDEHLFFCIFRSYALVVQLQCSISVLPITSRVQLPSHFLWSSMLPLEDTSFYSLSQDDRTYEPINCVN